jgi:hypothetical protein
VTITLDNTTAAQVRILAAELGLSETAAIARAVKLLMTALTVRKGIDARERERKSADDEKSS